MTAVPPLVLTPKPTPEDERLSDAIDLCLRLCDRVGESLEKNRGEPALMGELLRACTSYRQARISAERGR